MHITEKSLPYGYPALSAPGLTCAVQLEILPHKAVKERCKGVPYSVKVSKIVAVIISMCV